MANSSDSLAHHITSQAASADVPGMPRDGFVPGPSAEAAGRRLVNRLSSSGGLRLTTVESHTQGEPTRILVSGVPGLDSVTSAVEARDRLTSGLDDVRRLLMLEPRGHRNMFGAILFPPTRPDADLGVVFTDSGGCLNMCGHGSIGVSTFAVESGLVAPRKGSRAAAGNGDVKVHLDTPAGLITVTVHMREGAVLDATLTNVPAFVAEDDVVLDVDHPIVHQVHATIAFGGSFFALVDFDSLNLGYGIGTENAGRIADLGMAILKAAREQTDVRHPLVDIHGVDLVEFGSWNHATGHAINAVVFGDGQVDRSPCGTGTSAKLAVMMRRGLIRVGDSLKFDSITGSTFIGSPVKTTTVVGKPAIIPGITGRAYITGMSTWVRDPTDIYPYGFLV